MISIIYFIDFINRKDKILFINFIDFNDLPTYSLNRLFSSLFVMIFVYFNELIN